MTEIEVVDSYLFTCINLQLAAVAKSQVRDGKMDVKVLYKNLRNHSETKGFDLQDFNYANFLNFLNAHRDRFNVGAGEIGMDVSWLGLKNEVSEG